MQSRHESLEAFQAIVDRLRADTQSDRTTLRVDCPELELGLEKVAVESLAEGVNSIKSQTAPDIRNAAAPSWLLSHRRTFVMDDCLNPWDSELAPESYVLETYRVRSEMVSPVFEGQDLIGIISVHVTTGPRHWTAQAVARIEAACEAARDILHSFDSAP